MSKLYYFLTFQALEDIFLHHPVYGIYNRKTPRSGTKTDCDFCLWILYIGKQGVNDDVIADTEIGPLSMELACTYNAGNPWKAKKCPAAMAEIQQKLMLLININILKDTFLSSQENEIK